MPRTWGLEEGEQGLQVMLLLLLLPRPCRVLSGAAAPAHLYRLYRGLYIHVYALPSRSCGLGSSVATQLW